jgi:beta-lactamase regulating signal transducer with metallopeptidase domain
MSIVNVLGESAVRSLALALAVAVVLRLLRVRHARLAKRAWTAVLILSLAMPALVVLHIPSFSFTALWSTPRTVVVPVTPSISAANAFAPVAVDHSTAVSQTSAQFEEVAPVVSFNVPVPAALEGAPVPARHIAWWQIGFAAYLVITALLLLRVFLGLALASRLWRRAQSFATSETDLPGRLSGRLSVRLSVDLRSPATVGHGILLPLEAIEWDEATLRATLAHEAQHIREGDFYLQLAATLHHCFFWISPHAWWLRPQLSRLSETICDRAAIATSGDGLSYAELLLRLATAEQTPAGMVAMAQSAGLKERIDRLIADPELTSAFRHRRGQAIAAATLLAAAAIVAAATVHFVQPAAIVLAAPQAPAAPPASPTPAASPATPPAPAPQGTMPIPELPPPPSPDIAPAPAAAPGSGVGPSIGVGTGSGVGEGIGTGQTVVRVMPVTPRMHIETHVAPETYIKVVAIPEVDLATPVVSIGPLSMVHPLVLKNGTRILSIPQSEIVQADGNDVIELSGRNYAICGPDSHGTVHNCSLNGYDLRDHPAGAILFERDGKTYIVDDPDLVKQAQQAYSRVDELGKQQGELGAKQGKLGAQQGELGAMQGRLGSMQGQLGAADFHFDGPEFHFEMPQGFDKWVEDYTDSTTRLAVDEKLSDQERAQLEAEQKEAKANFDKAMAQWKAQEPQREAMEKQIREQTEQIRKQMQPLIQQMHELGAKQGELGRMQGELGRQQALLGMQQRDASREADTKVKSLIDQAMKNGKARPVQ